jgi:signal transduction histidine kinase/CheY-like chemotaxis protein
MTAEEVLRRLHRFQVVMVTFVLVMASIGVVIYSLASNQARSTQRTLVATEQLRGEVLSAETSLRGFALTGHDEFLQPYEDAGPRIRGLERQLARWLPGRDLATLRRIRTVFDEWHDDFAEQVLRHLDQGRRDAAVALIATGQGKARIDAIRADAATLTDDVRDTDADRQRLANAFGWTSLVLTVAAIVVMVVVTRRMRQRVDRDVSQPLAELRTVAERFGSGDMSARMYRSDGVTEVREVAGAFNGMADRIQTMIVDLRAVDRLKSEFVSVVSHELRTPLTSIRGSLGLLASGAMGELPPDAAEMLNIATSNTDRLVRLINDILDLERIESGNEALDIRPVRVGDVFAEAASGVQGAADAAGVTLEVDTPDIVVDGDSDRLVQAVTNLLGNAIKFSDPGTSVRLEAETRAHQVVLRVRDHGRGIPPEMLESVFERFQQVDASDAREKGGTGLGLAIVRTIVQRHGGRVEVDSEVGAGSCFSIVLPASSRLASAAAAVPASASALVVLAEDDSDLRRVVGTMLQRHGIEVVSATTAEAAVEQCKAELPDVLILDVRLAEGTGYEVVQALRQDDRLRSLPTVVYTVADLTAEQRSRLRLGETVFVAKGQRTDEALEQEVVDLLARARPA